MRFITKNIKIEKTAEIRAISKETFEISPNRASNNSGFSPKKSLHLP